MKTPIQELIEWLDKNKRNQNLNLSDVELFVKFNLIEKEKQVIKDAFNQGIVTEKIYYPDQHEEEFENYYNETFNQ